MDGEYTRVLSESIDNFNRVTNLLNNVYNRSKRKNGIKTRQNAISGIIKDIESSEPSIEKVKDALYLFENIKPLLQNIRKEIPNHNGVPMRISEVNNAINSLEATIRRSEMAEGLDVNSVEYEYRLHSNIIIEVLKGINQMFDNIPKNTSFTGAINQRKTEITRIIGLLSEHRDTCGCLGVGEKYKYLEQLNDASSVMKQSLILFTRLKTEFPKRPGIPKQIQEITKALPSLDEFINHKVSCVFGDLIPSDEVEDTSLGPYAPVIPPVQFQKNLYCISVKWLNDNGANLGAVTNAGNRTSEIYNSLSRGRIKFNVISQRIAVNFNKSPQNISKAVNAIKNALNAPKNSVFVIFHNRARGYSNAGNNIAYLYGTLLRDVLHEVGHAAFKLEHAGRYTFNMYNEIEQLKSYHDPDSFMGRFASQRINAPQLYFLGWLDETNVALNSPEDGPRTYVLEDLYKTRNSGGLKAIKIIQQGGKDIFVSQFDDKTMIYLQNGGGSQIVSRLGNNPLTFRDITFERNNNVITITRNNAFLRLKNHWDLSL